MVCLFKKQIIPQFFGYKITAKHISTKQPSTLIILSAKLAPNLNSSLTSLLSVFHKYPVAAFQKSLTVFPQPPPIATILYIC